MQPTRGVRVTGKNGLQGSVEETAGTGCSTPSVPVKLDDGRSLLVPAELLVRQADGSYYLSLSPEEIERAGAPSQPGETTPVIEERARIEKQAVQTGTVRVSTRTTEREEVLREPLMREQMEVERVAVNQPVDEPPPIRREGERIIIPLVEEVLVVEKRLVVREEIHLTPRRTTEMHEERVTLRRQDADVERSKETPGL